jgi:hypothetical protein
MYCDQRFLFGPCAGALCGRTPWVWGPAALNTQVRAPDQLTFALLRCVVALLSLHPHVLSTEAIILETRVWCYTVRTRV